MVNGYGGIILAFSVSPDTWAKFALDAWITEHHPADEGTDKKNQFYVARFPIYEYPYERRQVR